MSPLLEQIRCVEACAANALPASHLQIVDGWRLRYNHGVTRRANSVLAEAHGDSSLGEKFTLVDTFYRRFGVSPRFQITPVSQPNDLAEASRDYGYHHAESVDVLSAPLATLKRYAQATGEMPNTSPTLGTTWFDLYSCIEPHEGFKAEVKKRMLTHLVTPALFLTAVDQGKPVAVALGVVERGHLGVFNVATHPDARRRGAATTMLACLAGWAERQGATNVYLQVSRDNVPAQTLYRQLGFSRLYQYHYYERD